MRFSEILQETIDKLDLTNENFARLLGVPIRTLNNWLGEVSMPSLLVQDIVLQLYKNSDGINKHILRYDSWEIIKTSDIVKNNMKHGKDLIEATTAPNSDTLTGALYLVTRYWSIKGMKNKE